MSNAETTAHNSSQPTQASRPSDAEHMHPAQRPLTRLTAPAWCVLVVCGVLAGVLAWFAHGPALNKGEFILDDEKSIVQREVQIRHIESPAQFIKRFYDRPLVALTLRAQVLNIQPGKLRDHVTNFREFNAAVHIGVTLALLMVVALALRRTPLGPVTLACTAGAAAVLFAVHPLTTNVVAYPVQRSESMFALAVLIMLLGLHLAARWSWLGGPIAVLAAVAGMLSKAIMMAAPPLALLYDRAVISGSWARTLRERWWLHGLLLASWGLLVWPTRQFRFLEGGGGPGKSNSVGLSVEGITPWEYMRTQPEVVLNYLKLTFWPHGLALDRGYPVSEDVMVDVLLGAVLVAIAIAGLAFAAFGKRLALLGFSVVSVFVVLAPTSSFVPIRDLSFEHRFYLPLAAVLAMTVGLAAVGLHRASRGRVSLAFAAPAVLALAAVVAAGLVHRTRIEATAWQSKVTLLERDVAINPNHLRSRVNLAVAYMDTHDFVRATPHLEASLEIDPDHPFANYNYAIALEQQGDIDAAIFRLAKAAPQLEQPFGFEHLGRLLRRENRPEQAVQIFTKLNELRPNSPRVKANLGNALSDVGEFEQAAEIFGEAATLAREHYDVMTSASAEFNRGNMYYRLRRFDKAVEAYEACLRDRPRHARARQWLETARRHAVQLGQLPATIGEPSQPGE